METKQDISYGVVPLYKGTDEWQVLIVHQISYRGDDFWIFPKGHAEKGETPVGAALRELQEETGVSEVVLMNESPLCVSYSFTHEGVRIEKTVEYFVGVCTSLDTHISQPQEIKEIRWCSFAEAEALLSHQNSKEVLKKVKNLSLL